MQALHHTTEFTRHNGKLWNYSVALNSSTCNFNYSGRTLNCRYTLKHVTIFNIEITCKTANTQYLVINEPTCTLSMIIFMHFKYFGIAGYTMTFIILTVMCKGHNNSSMYAHYSFIKKKDIPD